MAGDVTEVFRDTDDKRRIEFWTDGTWVKLGRNVETDLCVEFRIEDFDTLEQQVRSYGAAEQFRLTRQLGDSEKYIVYTDGYDPGIFRVSQREVVLLLGDDYFPLYRAKSQALEARRETDPEQLALRYAESIRPHAEIRNCDERGLTGRVRMSFYRPGPSVNLGLVEDLQADDAIEADSVSVFREDDGHRYDFVVDTAAVPGGSDTVHDD